jgi:hypothetical protein
VLGDIGLGTLNPALQFLDRVFSLGQQIDKVKPGGMSQDPQASGRFSRRSGESSLIIILALINKRTKKMKKNSPSPVISL